MQGLQLWVSNSVYRTSVGAQGRHTGEAFEIETVLDNVSAGGFYMRLPQRVEVGAKLCAVVRRTTRTDSTAPTLGIAVCGVVRHASHSLIAGGVWVSGVCATASWPRGPKGRHQP